MRTHFPTNAHLFTEFAHRLFATSLKNERFSPTDPTHVRVLDPLLEVVADALTSKYADVIVQALRALCMLTRFGLPSMGRVLPRCFERCCKLIGRASSTATETVQNCFKLITVILRDCTSGKVKVDIKEQRLLALVNLIRPDLEECDNNSTTFALVKAILGRRVMAVEIYDLMDDVARVMVTNQTPHIREQCRHVLLQFLLDYPLGEKRLERHLLFLVRNLEYIHETGRVSVLELINSICIKFPQEVLDGWVDVLFLALAVRMVNEESAICREMVLALMQTLLRAVSLDRVDAVLKIVVGWRGQPVLQRTLVQCIGVVADAFVDVPDRRPWLRQRYVDDFARMLEDATEEFVQAEQQEEVEDDEEQATNASTQAWKTVYFALTSYGRLVKSYPSIMQDVAHSSVWTSAHTLLTHYHSWVRSAACRLWGAYLTTVDPTTRMFADTGMESFIYDVDAAVHLAESLVAQLCMPALTEEVGLQLVKNLVFMGRLLRAAPVPVDVAGDTEQDDHEENVVEEETVMVQDVFDDAEHETIKSNTRHRQRHPKRLHWLVRRLSFIARGELTTASGTAKRTHVFRWFAAMASVLCSGNGNNVISAAENSADAAAEELAEHAVAMLSPLHRTVVDETKRDEKNGMRKGCLNSS